MGIKNYIIITFLISVLAFSVESGCYPDYEIKFEDGIKECDSNSNNCKNNHYLPHDYYLKDLNCINIDLVYCYYSFYIHNNCESSLIFQDIYNCEISEFDIKYEQELVQSASGLIKENSIEIPTGWALVVHHPKRSINKSKKYFTIWHEYKDISIFCDAPYLVDDWFNLSISKNNSNLTLEGDYIIIEDKKMAVTNFGISFYIGLIIIIFSIIFLVYYNIKKKDK